MCNIDDIELGDMVEYNGKMLEVTGFMRGIPPLKDTVFYLYSPSKGHPVNMGIPFEFITSVVKKTKPEEKPSDKCICDSMLLAWQGCKCGFFQKEKTNEQGTT